MFRREQRFEAKVLFTAGVTGFVLLAAAFRLGFAAMTADIWLAAGLVALVLMYGHLSISVHQTHKELAYLKSLTGQLASKDGPPIALSQYDGRAADGVFLEEDRLIMARLGEAIEADRIEMFLQPVVSMPQRKIRFFEAYSRMRDAEGRLIGPQDYLAAAERSNRIGVVDNLILFRSVQALRSLLEQQPKVAFFCNVSPATLYDTEFFAQFISYLQNNKDLASHLIFELTYPAVQLMHPQVEENLRLVSDLGYGFSLDHVPTLNLDYEDLASKNFSYIKASTPLLVQSAQAGADYLEGLREAFRRHNISLIAEKIESEHDLPKIAELGIDYGQGNYFGAPRRADHYLAIDPPRVSSAA